MAIRLIDKSTLNEPLEDVRVVLRIDFTSFRVAIMRGLTRPQYERRCVEFSRFDLLPGTPGRMPESPEEVPSPVFFYQMSGYFDRMS